MLVEIMIGVGAVIEDRMGKILLVRHVPERGGFWQGKWICPGGKLEYGETIEQGIMREVKEETNLEIRLTTPLVPFDRVVKEEGETKLHVIYIDYLAEPVGGKLKPASDIGEAIWVRKEDLTKMWDELHDDTKRLLQIAGKIEGVASFQLFKERIEKALKTLTPRERRIIELRFGLEDGQLHTLNEVSEVFKVTKERIRQIEEKALQKVLRKLRQKGGQT